MTEESERKTLPTDTPSIVLRSGKTKGALTGTLSPEKNKMPSGFEMVASAAYAHFGSNSNDLGLPFPGIRPAGNTNTNDNSKRQSPAGGMNINTFAKNSASPMD